MTLKQRPLLIAQDITKHYPVASSLPWSPPKAVRAVDGLSFDVPPGKTVSIVGESGCGKTTTIKLLLRLEDPTSGRVLFRNRDIAGLDPNEEARFRRSVQAVFQNPYSSLDPRMRVLDLIGEPLAIRGDTGKDEIRSEVERQLDAVGLDRTIINSFPHELSGGMRQRVAIARALILRPDLIVLDEPVSALDVSVRAQIMNLFKEIQDDSGVAYVLISHDLATTRYLSHRVLVMYLGQMVETAECNELYSNPLHPYTIALIAASAPTRRWEAESRKEVLESDLPSPMAPPSGCRFHTRCPRAFDRCSADIPELREVAPGHRVACHLY